MEKQIDKLRERQIEIFNRQKDDIILPKEIEKLLDIARIKNMARSKSILKISQKEERVIFSFYFVLLLLN